VRVFQPGREKFLKRLLFQVTVIFAKHPGAKRRDEMTVTFLSYNLNNPSWGNHYARFSQTPRFSLPLLERQTRLARAIPLINPSGPDNGASRVLRGGGWQSSLSGIRTTNRYFSSQTFEYNIGRAKEGNEIGFRCARDAE
jgi:hypothetical protein